MRTLAALGITLSILLTASPAQATETWEPGGDFGSPVYGTPILVVDSVMSTVPQSHRKAWRQSRDSALEQWGLAFTVQRMNESALAYPWTDENINAGLAITDAIPGAILLVRMRSVFNQECAGWLDDVQAGIVAYSTWAPLWKDNRANAAVIAHEVGHALGFGHGGNGVMSGNYKVNDTERMMAATYYG